MTNETTTNSRNGRGHCRDNRKGTSTERRTMTDYETAVELQVAAVRKLGNLRDARRYADSSLVAMHDSPEMRTVALDYLAALDRAVNAAELALSVRTTQARMAYEREKV